jgi:hypothetical protein
MFMVSLTILFSALLSSTARRFLICSSGSAHLTARGVVAPSIRCFSSRAAMACTGSTRQHSSIQQAYKSHTGATDEQSTCLSGLRRGA